MKRGPEDQGYWAQTLSEYTTVRRSLLDLPLSSLFLLIKYLLNHYWAKPGLGVWTERGKIHKSFLSLALHSNGEAWVDRKWEVNSVFENDGRLGVKGRHEMVQATLEAQKVIWGRPLRGSFWFTVYSYWERQPNKYLGKSIAGGVKSQYKGPEAAACPKDMSNKEASTAKIRYKETRPQRTRGPAFFLVTQIEPFT